jgi:signal peptidase
VDRPVLSSDDDGRRRRRGLLVPAAALGVAVLVPVCALLGMAFLSGWKFQPIDTGSMAPLHPSGSLAVVEPFDASGVRPGMVVVFEDPLAPGRLVAHRAVERLPGTAPRWTTKGDANAEADPTPVAAAAIRGRVRWTIPGAGSVVSALQGWTAVLLLVGGPLTVLLATEVHRTRTRRSVAAADVPTT